MLVVVNPRVEPAATIRGWSRYNSKLVAFLVIWAIALLAVAALGEYALVSPDRWYSVSFAEGATIYTGYATEEECLAEVIGDIEGCIAGKNLH